MRKLHLTVILISCLVMLAVAAGGARTQSKKPLMGSAKDFERAKFDKSSPYITNKYLPLKPGTKLIYKGSAIPEGEKTRVKRRVVSTVTDLSKWIDGVRTLVIWEKDYTARKTALKLDNRAYQRSGEVYGKTPKAKPLKK